ncbi:MAG: hypothetical protein AAF628_08720 [Planctomycetota bacterium]
MHSLLQISTAALLTSLAATLPPPNRFAGTTETVAPGGTINIKFSDPSKGGQTVKVTATDGVNDQSEDVFITLDSSGNGSAPFQVPAGWTNAVLSGPASQDMHVPVVPQS